jgi:LysM repeat protein
LLVATVLAVVAMAAGAVAYWYVSSRGTTPHIEVATAPDVPSVPADDMTPPIVPDTPAPAVSDASTPTTSAPPVPADAGISPSTTIPDTKIGGPDVKVSDLPGSTPNVSIVDLGFGNSEGQGRITDIPLLAPTSTDTPDKTTSKAPEASAQETAREYKVKSGDTLSKIADANKVDVKDLQWWNSLKDPNNLVADQTLFLYERPGLQPKDKFFASIPKPAPTPPPTTPKVAQTPEVPQEPAAPPPAKETKQPPKKKTVKEFFQGIFHK